MGKTKAKKGIGMIFKPAQLGLARLDAHELEEDKKACRKIGPCGVGKKALYLNSFYIDRRYYLPYGSITRSSLKLHCFCLPPSYSTTRYAIEANIPLPVKPPELMATRLNTRVMLP